MDKNQKFIELLEENYQWPDYYTFKFIVRAEDKSSILEMLVDFQISETASKKGNYISITARKLIKNTQEVIEVYESIGSIKGVIGL